MSDSNKIDLNGHALTVEDIEEAAARAINNFGQPDVIYGLPHVSCHPIFWRHPGFYRTLVRFQLLKGFEVE